MRKAFSEMIGPAIGMVADDVALGAYKFVDQRRKRNAGATPSIMGARGFSGAPKVPANPTGFTKKESNTMSGTQIARTEADFDGATDLADILEKCATPEAKASLLIKMAFYRNELVQQQELLSNVDPELCAEVAERWFDEGDMLLKRAIWNAQAGQEEILAPDEEKPANGELALAKMLADCPTDGARGHLLHKVGSYSRDFENAMAALVDETPERKQDLTKAWIEAGDPVIKCAIVDIVEKRGGRFRGDAAMGTPAMRDVVTHVAGNGPTHGMSRMHHGKGGEGKTPVGHSIMRVSARPGAGRRVKPGDHMFRDRGDPDHPTLGSGKTQNGEKELKPTVHITRKGTTGGLGSTGMGSGTGDGSGMRRAAVTGRNVRKGVMFDDDVGGDGFVTKDGVHYATGVSDHVDDDDLATDLLKIAPDAMIEAIGTLDPEDQRAVCEIAADQAADLMTWADSIDPGSLAKRDMDVAVEEWLAEDPDTIDLKKWVAEALVTAEEIPVSLGRAIMAWEPDMEKVDWGGVANRVRQAVEPLATRVGTAAAAATRMGREGVARLPGATRAAMARGAQLSQGAMARGAQAGHAAMARGAQIGRQAGEFATRSPLHTAALAGAAGAVGAGAGGYAVGEARGRRRFPIKEPA